ncbi:MAG: hypothetical protein H6738_07395 [Alphaproteobacteria bacterium]|nr:hypothetical protein [Alphaproteobacteria bacterium]MCB9696588.1 hypothetical protein [Alphaproteobacteria bacterium]
MLLLLPILAGCALHRVGVVEVVEEGPVRLVSVDGRDRLLLLGEAERLRYLDGHLVELDGTKTLGRLRVGQWRVIEGPRGLPVWYGPVQVLGSQVGIQDLGSGMFVYVDARAAERLRSKAGEWVLVEGYVEGPQRVVVLHWRSLD